MTALSWLAKQLAWEQRLSELRVQRPGVTKAASPTRPLRSAPVPRPARAA